VFHGCWFIGTVDFCLFEKRSISLPHHAPEILPALWGVTLPNIYEFSPGGAGRDDYRNRMGSFRPVASVVWGLHTGAGINVVCARQRKMKFQRIVPSEHFVAEGVVTENVPALHEQVGVVPKNRASKVIAGSAIVSFSEQWKLR
jgi:hypothetical protein